MNDVKEVEKSKREIKIQSGPSLEQRVEAIVSKTKNQVETRKNLLTFLVGFLDDKSLTQRLRQVGVGTTEIESFTQNFSTRTQAVAETVLAIKLFPSIKREELLKINCVDSTDWNYLIKHLPVDSLNVSDCQYEYPDSVDKYMLSCITPNCQPIETQSPFGRLVEEYCLLEAVPSFVTSIRKMFVDFMLNSISESKLIEDLVDKATSYGGRLRKIVLYCEKNYKAVQNSFFNNVKSDNKEIIADCDYIKLVQKQ